MQIWPLKVEGKQFRSKCEKEEWVDGGWGLARCIPLLLLEMAVSKSNLVFILRLDFYLRFWPAEHRRSVPLLPPSALFVVVSALFIRLHVLLLAEAVKQTLTRYDTHRAAPQVAPFTPPAESGLFLSAQI